MDVAMVIFATIGGLTLLLGVIGFISMVFANTSELSRLRQRVKDHSECSHREFNEIYRNIRELKETIRDPAKPRK